MFWSPKFFDGHCCRAGDEVVERKQGKTSELPSASRRRSTRFLARWGGSARLLSFLTLRSSLLSPRLARDRAAQLPHTRTLQHHLHHDMHAMDVDTVVDLPGGDNYEDVTRVFAEAANGESCAHYVSSEKSDAVPPTVDMDPEALIMTKTFSLLDAMSAFEVGTVAPE